MTHQYQTLQLNDSIMINWRNRELDQPRWSLCYSDQINNHLEPYHAHLDYLHREMVFESPTHYTQFVLKYSS